LKFLHIIKEKLHTVKTLKVGKERWINLILLNW
jgi:hypothetical protein